MFVDTISYKLLAGILPNLQLFGAVGDKDKLIRFWG